MFFHEDFVVESFEKCDVLADENDNYKYVEQPINVAPTHSDLNDEPLCKILHVESIPESVFDSDESSRESHQQRTMHWKYFSELPRETSSVDLDRDEPEKMDNIPLLLHQLQSARVVLERLSDKPIDVQVPTRESNNPVELPTSTCKIGVQRYCHNCKILGIDDNLEICSKCSATLLYVCDKCNENYYHIYKCFTRHRRQCKGRKIGKSLKNFTAIHCAGCSFETSYRISMKIHAKITGHKVLDEEPLSSEAFTEIHLEEQRNSVSTSDYQLKYLVKRNHIDYSIARKRYCPTCAKIVDNQSANEAKSCEICNTILLYQCGNCNHRCARYRNFNYHLKTRCYPSVYRCPECHYTTSIWHSMSRHLKRRRSRSFADVADKEIRERALLVWN